MEDNPHTRTLRVLPLTLMGCGYIDEVIFMIRLLSSGSCIDMALMVRGERYRGFLFVRLQTQF